MTRARRDAVRRLVCELLIRKLRLPPILASAVIRRLPDQLLVEIIHSRKKANEE